MQIYEISFLILPSVAEDALPSAVEKIKGSITKAGGMEIDSEAPFKHPLSYPMSKTVGASRYVVDEAYIGWIKFDLPAEASAQAGIEHPIEKIKTSLEKLPEVLRFLIAKAPRKTEFTFAKAKAAIKAKEEKEKQEKEDALSEVAEPTSAEDAAVPAEAVVE